MDRKRESILARRASSSGGDAMRLTSPWPHVQQISDLPWAPRSHVSAVGMLVGAEAAAHSYLSGGIYSAHTHSQVDKVNTLAGTTPDGSRKLTFSSASCSANNSSPR